MPNPVTPLNAALEGRYQMDREQQAARHQSSCPLYGRNLMSTIKHPSRFLITLAIAACASSGGGDGSSRRDADLIGTAELTENRDRTVMEAVERLRPQWLRPTGMRRELPTVMMDGQAYDLDILRNIEPENVEMLRFVNATDASFRWGSEHTSGVIEVRTR